MELSGREGWRRVELRSEFLSAHELLDVRLVRAPGHREAELSSERHEIVLAPVASLEIVNAPDEWSSSVVIEPGLPEDLRASSLEPYCCASGSGVRRWALAFDPAQLSQKFGRLEVENRLANQTEVYLSIDIGTPRSSVYSWPLGGSGKPTASLDVFLDGASGEGPCEVAIRTVPGPTQERLLLHETTGWGEVAVQQALHGETREVSDGAARFSGVPLGARYAITAWNRETGAHARDEFVFDGLPARLTLAEGVHWTGRVIARSGAGPSAVDLRWTLLDDEGKPQGIDGRIEALPLTSTGDFQAHVPDSPRELSSWPTVAHPHFRIEVTAKGFEPARVSCAGVSDLGVIELERRRPDFFLRTSEDGASLHGRELEVLDEHSARAILFEVEDALASEPGVLAVFLARDEGRPRSYPPGAGDWPSPRACVLALPDADARALELQDGNYVVADMRAVHLRVRASARFVEAGVDLAIGWRWHGQYHQAVRLRAAALEKEQEGVIHMPVDAELAWAVGDVDQRDWQAVPRAEDEVTLEVP